MSWKSIYGRLCKEIDAFSKIQNLKISSLRNVKLIATKNHRDKNEITAL